MKGFSLLIVFKFVLHLKIAKEVSVRYGEDGTLELQEKRYTVNTYKAGDLCHSPANSTGFWDPGYIYDVLLTGLKPNTRYFYSIRNEQASEFHSLVFNDINISPKPKTYRLFPVRTRCISTL